MDQQVTIGLGPQQGLEDAVNLGIDGMAHGGSVDSRCRCDKGRGSGEPRPAGCTDGSAGSAARTASRAEPTDARSAPATRTGLLGNQELTTLPHLAECCWVLQSQMRDCKT
jgi:hypothetical protein